MKLAAIVLLSFSCQDWPQADLNWTLEMKTPTNITTKGNTFTKNMTKMVKISATIATTMNMKIMESKERRNLTQSLQPRLQEDLIFHQQLEELQLPPQLQEDPTFHQQLGGVLRQQGCLVKDSCQAELGIPTSRRVEQTTTPMMDLSKTVEPGLEDSTTPVSLPEEPNVDEYGNKLVYLGYRKEDYFCPEGYVLDIYGYC